jgi:protein SCO1/2
MLSGFVDDLGRPVTRDTLQRPYQLIVFGYTSCPDVCPLTLQAVHRALVRLRSKAAMVDPVFVTVDPDRDSEAKLHQYVSAFDDRIRGYRGGDEALDRLTKILDVHYWRESLTPGSKDYWMSHTATLFLIGRDRHVVARVDHVDDPAKLSLAITHAVYMALAERL